MIQKIPEPSRLDPITTLVRLLELANRHRRRQPMEAVS